MTPPTASLFSEASGASNARELGLISLPISNVWTASFYGYDGGGNVRNLTNANGGVTDQYEYDAFGNEFTVTGGSSTPNNYMYRGEQFDSDLGLLNRTQQRFDGISIVKGWKRV